MPIKSIFKFVTTCVFLSRRCTSIFIRGNIWGEGGSGPLRLSSPKMTPDLNIYREKNTGDIDFYQRKAVEMKAEQKQPAHSSICSSLDDFLLCMYLIYTYIYSTNLGTDRKLIFIKAKLLSLYDSQDSFCKINSNKVI